MSGGRIAVAVAVAWFLAALGLDASKRMSADDVRAIIRRLNLQEFGGWFSEAAVMAVVDIESGFNPSALRLEPQLVPPDASVGLMQVLLSTARDRGYIGPINGLFDPEVNILIGMRHLKWTYDFLDQRINGEVSEALWIGAYNAGVGNALKGFTPQAYVDKWRAARSRWN